MESLGKSRHVFLSSQLVTDLIHGMDLDWFIRDVEAVCLGFRESTMFLSTAELQT